MVTSPIAVCRNGELFMMAKDAGVMNGVKNKRCSWWGIGDNYLWKRWYCGFTIESSFIVLSFWCKWGGLQLILADFLILLFSLFAFVLLAGWFLCWNGICLPGFDVMPVKSNFMFFESFAFSWENQCIGLCHNKCLLFFLIFVVPLFPDLSIPLLLLHGTQLIFLFFWRPAAEKEWRILSLFFWKIGIILKIILKRRWWS